MTILTTQAVRELARVIDACDREVPVTWESGNAVLTGVIRHLHAGPAQDVWDLTVRVSGTFEFTFTMREVVAMVNEGTMALDYRP